MDPWEFTFLLSKKMIFSQNKFDYFSCSQNKLNFLGEKSEADLWQRRAKRFVELNHCPDGSSISQGTWLNSFYFYFYSYICYVWHEQIPGDSGEEQSRACCSPWSCRIRCALVTEHAGFKTKPEFSEKACPPKLIDFIYFNSLHTNQEVKNKSWVVITGRSVMKILKMDRGTISLFKEQYPDLCFEAVSKPFFRSLLENVISK